MLVALARGHTLVEAREHTLEEAGGHTVAQVRGHTQWHWKERAQRGRCTAIT